MDSAGVRLIIKAPNQQIEDQIISCELGWTIQRLKDYLSKVYPSNPKIKDQKLIYSGQLLNDSICLKDILRHYDNTEDQPFTVHLVCAPSKTSDVKTIVDHGSSDASGLSNTSNPPETSNGFSEQHEAINTQPAAAQFYSTQTYYSQLSNQQIVWMQQAYSNYLTQYMQLMAAQGVQVPNSMPYVQATNLNSNNPVNNSTNVSNNNNRNAEENEQPRQVPQDAEFNNGGDDAGIGLNRDWLDVGYMMTRIVIIFSIVYFYSSPIRFLIVTFLGFAIYLYQGGIFRVNPAMLPENNNGRPENNNQVPQNEAVDQEVQQQEQVPRNEIEERTIPNEENEDERPGALAFTWTFFSSFFASLIPDQPNFL